MLQIATKWTALQWQLENEKRAKKATLEPVFGLVSAVQHGGVRRTGAPPYVDTVWKAPFLPI